MQSDTRLAGTSEASVITLIKAVIDWVARKPSTYMKYLLGLEKRE